MKRINKKGFLTILLLISIFLIPNLFNASFENSALAQAQAEGVILAKKQEATGEKSDASDIAALQKRIMELERRIQELHVKNKTMASQMRQLNQIVGKALSKKGTGKGAGIKKVTRIAGGRPGTKDAMVSVAHLVGVWNQMDVIMNKLDEITTKLSQ